MSAETPTLASLTADPAFRTDPVTPDYCRKQLVTALESLGYVAYHADLDAEETSSLDHARAVLRALRDDLGKAVSCGHDH